MNSRDQAVLKLLMMPLMQIWIQLKAMTSLMLDGRQLENGDVDACVAILLMRESSILIGQIRNLDRESDCGKYKS